MSASETLRESPAGLSLSSQSPPAASLKLLSSPEVKSSKAAAAAAARETEQQETVPRKKPGPLASLIGGFLAGTVSRTATAPLDRIKVLAQEGRVHLKPKRHPTLHVPEDPKAKPTSFRQMAVHVYRDGGMASFWRGNGANCLKAGPELGLVFGFRNVLMENVCAPWTRGDVDLIPASWFSEEAARRDTPPWYWVELSTSHRTIVANFVTSAAAGAAAQLIVYPLETTKTRIAVATSGEYTGIVDCIIQSYRRGGIRDFYKGLAANLTGIVPYRGLEMGFFYTFQNQIVATRTKIWTKHQNMAEKDVLLDRRDEHENIINQSLSEFTTLSLGDVAGVGMVASIIAQTATYPMNLVRTRLQTQGVNGRPAQYRGMAHCFQSILRTDGPVGLFRGLSANFLKAVPASVLTFVIVDRFQNFVVKFNSDSTSSSRR